MPLLLPPPPPQRHCSCRTQHLGLTPLPFKISSLQISKGAAHAGFITQRQRHQRQLALWSLGGLQLTASVYKSLSDKSRLLDRHFTGGAFRCDRKQSICQIILLISQHIQLKKLLSWGFTNDNINWKTEIIRVLAKVGQMRQSAERSDLDYNWNKRLKNKQNTQWLALELLATQHFQSVVVQFRLQIKVKQINKLSLYINWLILPGLFFSRCIHFLCPAIVKNSSGGKKTLIR